MYGFVGLPEKQCGTKLVLDDRYNEDRELIKDDFSSLYTNR